MGSSTYFMEQSQNVAFRLFFQSHVSCPVLSQFFGSEKRLEDVQGVEHFGEDEVKKRPQLSQIILEGCARQEETIDGAHGRKGSAKHVHKWEI